MQNLANQQVMKCFENLNDQDYFGFISLSKNMECLQLEKKERNTNMKMSFMQKVARNFDARDGAKMGRLGNALTKALDW